MNAHWRNTKEGGICVSGQNGQIKWHPRAINWARLSQTWERTVWLKQSRQNKWLSLHMTCALPFWISKRHTWQIIWDCSGSDDENKMVAADEDTIHHQTPPYTTIWHHHMPPHIYLPSCFWDFFVGASADFSRCLPGVFLASPFWDFFVVNPWHCLPTASWRLSTHQASFLYVLTEHLASQSLQIM